MPRLVLDTNILVSALITKGSIPDALYQGWILHESVLVTSHEQLFEFERVTSSSKLQRFISSEDRQEMLMLLRRNGEIVSQLPIVTFSTDPDDNLLSPPRSRVKRITWLRAINVTFYTYLRQEGSSS